MTAPTEKTTRAPESEAASQALQADRTFDIPDAKKLRHTAAYSDIPGGILKNERQAQWQR